MSASSHQSGGGPPPGRRRYNQNDTRRSGTSRASPPGLIITTNPNSTNSTAATVSTSMSSPHSPRTMSPSDQFVSVLGASASPKPVPISVSASVPVTAHSSSYVNQSRTVIIDTNFQNADTLLVNSAGATTTTTASPATAASDELIQPQPSGTRSLTNSSPTPAPTTPAVAPVAAPPGSPVTTISNLPPSRNKRPHSTSDPTKPASNNHDNKHDLAARDDDDDDDNDDSDFEADPKAVSARAVAELDINSPDYAIPWVTVFTLLFTAVTCDMARGMFTPSLSPYVTSLHGDGVLYGVAMAMFDAGRVLGAPVLGRFVARTSYRTVFTLSLCGAIASHLLYICAVDWGRYVLVCARFTAGFTTGLMGSCRAYIVAIAPTVRRTEFVAWLSALQFLGAVASPGLAASLSTFVSSQPINVLGLTINKYTMPALAVLVCTIVMLMVNWVTLAPPPLSPPAHFDHSILSTTTTTLIRSKDGYQPINDITKPSTPPTTPQPGGTIATNARSQPSSPPTSTASGLLNAPTVGSPVAGATSGSLMGGYQALDHGDMFDVDINAAERYGRPSAPSTSHGTFTSNATTEQLSSGLAASDLSSGDGNSVPTAFGHKGTSSPTSPSPLSSSLQSTPFALPPTAPTVVHTTQPTSPLLAAYRANYPVPPHIIVSTPAIMAPRRLPYLSAPYSPNMPSSQVRGPQLSTLPPALLATLPNDTIEWSCSSAWFFFSFCAINWGVKGVISTSDTLYVYVHRSVWNDPANEAYDAGIYYMIFGLIGASFFLWLSYLAQKLTGRVLLGIGCAAIFCGGVLLNGFVPSSEPITFTQFTVAMSCIYCIGFPICQTMLITTCSAMLTATHPHVTKQSTLLSILDSCGSAARIVAPIVAGVLYSLGSANVDDHDADDFAFGLNGEVLCLAYAAVMAIGILVLLHRTSTAVALALPSGGQLSLTNGPVSVSSGSKPMAVPSYGTTVSSSRSLFSSHSAGGMSAPGLPSGLFSWQHRQQQPQQQSSPSSGPTGSLTPGPRVSTASYAYT